MVECKDIISLLKVDKHANTVDMQLKGASYEVTIDHGFDEAMMIMESARLQATAAEITKGARARAPSVTPARSKRHARCSDQSTAA